MSDSGERLVRRDQAIHEYLAATARGEPIQAEVFLARYPELRDLLEPALLTSGVLSSVMASPARQPAIEFAELAPGQKLGRYRLLAKLGSGGMGVVWLAQDEALDEEVALKFLPRVLATDRIALKHLRQEARVLLSLTHLNIVRLRTFDTHEPHAFLVMEYLRGPTLYEVVDGLLGGRGRGLSAGEALWVLEQVAPALDYAHGAGITHRDIKPSNLMLDRPFEGSMEHSGARLKLTDFGLAFVATASLSQKSSYRPSGTLLFMAPEVLMGGKPTPVADVYSLGATLYALIRGTPPFTHGDIVAQVLHRMPEPLRSGDAKLDEAIRAAMAKDPAQRPASLSALLALARGAIDLEEAQRTIRPRARNGARRRWFAAGVALAAGTAILGAWRPWSALTKAADTPTTPAATMTPPPALPTAIELSAPRVVRGGVHVTKDGVLVIAGRVENARSQELTIVHDDSELRTLRLDPQGAFSVRHLLGTEISKLSVEAPGSQPFEFHVVRDVDPPALVLTEPSVAELRSASTEIELHGTARDEHLQSVRVAENEIQVDATGAWTVRVSLPVEGTNAFSLVAADAVGNVSDLPMSIVRDTRGPVLVRAEDAQGQGEKGDPSRLVLRAGRRVVLALAFDEVVRTASCAGSDVGLLPDSRDGRIELLVPAVSAPWRLEWSATDDLGNLGTGTIELDVRVQARVPEGWHIVEDEPGFDRWARRIRDPRTGSTFILVDPGAFLFGSPEHEGELEEQPQRLVHVDVPFYMSESETGIAQWKTYVEETARATRAEADGRSWSHSADGSVRLEPGAHWKDPFPALNPAHSELEGPVLHVSWNDARAYCDHYGYRLPSEVEWEYACRAGRTGTYWWGDDPAAGRGRANVADRSSSMPVAGRFEFDDGFPMLSTLGRIAANAWGFRDMLGSAWEWCADAYDEEAAHGPCADSAHVDAPRTIRGGAWSSGMTDARCSRRSFESPDEHRDDLGFRAVYVPPGVSQTQPVTHEAHVQIERERLVRTPIGTNVVQGKYRRAHPRGVVLVEGQYKDGRREGTWTWNHPSGRLQRRGKYRDGLAIGSWVEKDERSKKLWEADFEHGWRQGKCSQFLADGATLDTANSGEFQHATLRVNERLQAEGETLDGLAHGRWSYYWSNGQKQISGVYRRGIAEGEWLLWHPDGTPECTILSGVYENGSRTATTGVHAWQPTASDSKRSVAPAPAAEPARLPPSSAASDRAAEELLEAALRGEAGAWTALREQGRAVRGTLMEALRGLDVARPEDARNARLLQEELLRPLFRGYAFEWRSEDDEQAITANKLTVMRWFTLLELVSQDVVYWTIDLALEPAHAQVEPDDSPLVRPPLPRPLGKAGPRVRQPPRVDLSRLNGGQSKVILDGLRWLVRHQNEDGSWSATRLHELCPPEAPCFDPKQRYDATADIGLTALSLLAFVGAGFDLASEQDLVDTSRAKRHALHEVIAKAAAWLIALQDPATGEILSRGRESVMAAVAATAPPALPSPAACDYCHGSGKVDCGACSGGKVGCSCMNGLTSNGQPCTVCSRTGRRPCGTCSGSSFLACTTCGGTGTRSRVVPFTRSALSSASTLGATPPHSHAYATIALCELAARSDSPALRIAAGRAIAFLQRAQRPSPTGEGLWGWRYASRLDVEELQGSRRILDLQAAQELVDSDVPSTAACALALARARSLGFEVPQANTDGAVAFCKWVTADNGLVGYVDPKRAGQTVTGKNDHFTYHPTTMSALGVCMRIFAKHNPDDPFLELAAKRIVADLPTVSKDKLSVDYYYWYYGTIALNQLDGPDSPRKSGKYWGPWNKAMVDSVTSIQDKSERTCQSGGWLSGDRWACVGGPVHSTAVNLLTLEAALLPNALAGARQVGDPRGR